MFGLPFISNKGKRVKSLLRQRGISIDDSRTINRKSQRRPDRKYAPRINDRRRRSRHVIGVISKIRRADRKYGNGWLTSLISLSETNLSIVLAQITNHLI